MTERPKTEEFNKKDPALDLSLRPSKFRDFVGQVRVKERLELFLGRDRRHRPALSPSGRDRNTLRHNY